MNDTLKIFTALLEWQGRVIRDPRISAEHKNVLIGLACRPAQNGDQTVSYSDLGRETGATKGRARKAVLKGIETGHVRRVASRTRVDGGDDANTYSLIR